MLLQSYDNYASRLLLLLDLNKIQHISEKYNFAGFRGGFLLKNQYPMF
jgi:hypothetical protein